MLAPVITAAIAAMRFKRTLYRKEQEKQSSEGYPASRLILGEVGIAGSRAATQARTDAISTKITPTIGRGIFLRIFQTTKLIDDPPRGGARE
jgi:hypothetical protein